MAVLLGAVCATLAGPISAEVLFVEEFEDAGFAARGWYDGTSVPLSALEFVPGSTRSAEFRYAKGQTTPGGLSAMRRLFSATDSVYVSYYIKYSANWVGSGTSDHPHEFLLLTDVDGKWHPPAESHLTGYIEQNAGIPRLVIQDSLNIVSANLSQSQSLDNLVGKTEVRAVSGCNGDSDGHGLGDCYLWGSTWRNGKAWKAPVAYFTNSPGPYYKGDWHRVEAYLKLNSIASGKGVADGIMKYWFDGKAVLDYTNIVFRTGQNPTMKFNQFMIGPYIGGTSSSLGSPTDQTFWIDKLVVSTSRETTAPNPPSLDVVD